MTLIVPERVMVEPLPLIPLASVLSMETTDGPWCIVRYLNGKFCGPIAHLGGYDSPPASGFGFPEGGEIGVVVWFETEREAREFFGPQALTHIENRATARADLHFSAEEYSHHDGAKRVLYDGGDYRTARAAVWLRRGEIAATRVNAGAWKVSLMCRPASGLAPGSRRL